MGSRPNAIEFDSGECDETDEEAPRTSENTLRNVRRGLRHI